MSYHVSNLGAFVYGLRPDLGGYVHETAEEVLGGWWAWPLPTDDEAEEIAALNRAATAEAERRIAEWRTGARVGERR